MLLPGTLKLLSLPEPVKVRGSSYWSSAVVACRVVPMTPRLIPYTTHGGGSQVTCGVEGREENRSTSIKAASGIK